MTDLYIISKIEKLQDDISELKSMLMEMRTTMKQHIEGLPDYSE